MDIKWLVNIIVASICCVIYGVMDAVLDLGYSTDFYPIIFWLVIIALYVSDD